MKRIAMALTALCTVGAAPSGNWYLTDHYETNEEKNYSFINKSSIHQIDDTRKSAEVVEYNYKSSYGDGMAFTKSIRIYDCKNESMGDIEEQKYDNNGKMGLVALEGASDSIRVTMNLDADDSLGDFQLVCKQDADDDVHLGPIDNILTLVKRADSYMKSNPTHEFPNAS